MTVKIFPYRLHRNPRGFLRSCGIRKTSLRQRLHSTATLFGCFQYIRNGCSSQDLGRKKCSCPSKIYRGTGAGLGFERTASTASVCTRAEKQCLPYRSDLLNSKHIRCGHTPEKWRSGLFAEASFFFFGRLPNPLFKPLQNLSGYSGSCLDFIRLNEYNIYCIIVSIPKIMAIGGYEMKYLSVMETAERGGISTRRIQILCNEARIPGAIRIGRTWAIPDNEPKPADARIKSGKYIKKPDENGVR